MRNAPSVAKIYLAIRPPISPPYIVTFLVGLIFKPIALVLTASGASGFGLPVLLLAAVGSAVLLLPPMKGAALGLLWAVDETN